MRKIKCFCSTGYVGSRREENIEVEDDATEDELQEEFQNWLNNNTDMGWCEIKEGCV